MHRSLHKPAARCADLSTDAQTAPQGYPQMDSYRSTYTIVIRSTGGSCYSVTDRRKEERPEVIATPRNARIRHALPATNEPMHSRTGPSLCPAERPVNMTDPSREPVAIGDVLQDLMPTLHPDLGPCSCPWCDLDAPPTDWDQEAGES